MDTSWFSSHLSTRILILLVVLQLCSMVSAQPIDLSELLSRGLLPRDRAKINNDTGIARVFTPLGEAVVQGPASDGAGAGMDLPAIVWIIFCAIIALPIGLAGIRGWRLTAGTGIGLAVSISSYAALINTVDEVGVSDLVLTFIVVAFFFLGFILGLFEFARLGGVVLIGVTGGIALGIRIVLSLENLIFSKVELYPVNWVIIAVLGATGGLMMMWKQRVGLLFGCASVGSFLGAVALDLIMSKQNGMSRGLRLLLDRNPSHLVDIFENGYHPTLMTRIIIWSSMGLIPVLGLAQHFIFRQPFDRRPPPDDSELQIDYPPEPVDENDEKLRPLTQGFLAHLWEGATGRDASPNRFSLESFTMNSKAKGRPVR